MSTNRHNLMITIGATLGGSFSSVVTGSTTQIQKLGGVIKNLEFQSTVGVSALDRLKVRYNSLMTSINRQQSILAKRDFYKGQILGVIGLGTALATPIRSAMKFESAMADVGKVVDFEKADGLQQMGKALRNLSREIPLSVEGLAEITAAGGQLGVKEKDLVFFTTNVAKMSTAFDMLPNEAGKAMATLSNVFDIPITSLTNLGDAINHISNNSASAARDIVPALARAGGAARQFGLSAENASAFVGTLISMGKAPEEAGTATAAILQRLQLADKLGKKAVNAFERVGISATDFGEMLRKDAQGALVTFLTSLSKLKGQNLTSVLVDIFGKEYSKTVATLVGSLGKYKEQLDLVSKPTNYGGSMEKEFQTRSKTTENSIQLLKNSLTDLAISLGEVLLPIVNKITETLKGFLTKITDWTSKNAELTSTIVKAVAGFVTFRIGLFSLGFASTFVLGGFNRIIIGLKGMRIGFTLFGVVLKSLLFGAFGKFTAIIGGFSLISSVFSAEFRAGIIEFFVRLSPRLISFYKTFKEKIYPILGKMLGRIKVFANRMKGMIPRGL